MREAASEAVFPFIFSGLGVVLADTIRDAAALEKKFDAPVCSNYQQNDSLADFRRLG